jgi:hypothetical protein
MFTLSIAVVTIDVNGLRSRLSELRNLISKLNDIYDDTVYILNDTRLNPLIPNINIEKYSSFRCDKNTFDSSAGGVAILVPSTWTTEETNIDDARNGYEAKGIITSPPGCEPIKICTIYNHPGHHVSNEVIKKFVDLRYNNKPVKGLLCGNLNSPHEAFSSRFSNEFGNSLLNLVNMNNLILLNNEDPTFYHATTGNHNILDLSFCEPHSMSLINTCYVGDDIATDHLPVITSISLPTRLPKNKHENRTRKVLDHHAFLKAIESKFNNFDSRCSTAAEVDAKLSECKHFFKTSIEDNTREVRIRGKRQNVSADILS